MDDILARWRSSEHPDAAGQLTDADYTSLPDENYQYDENGNRIGGDYQVGNNNQILSDGEFDYAYDDEGNLVLKTEISSGNVTTYEYDHRNRLIHMETETSGSVLLSELDFVYDAFDRLIATTIDDDGAGTNAAVSSYRFYDEGHVWAEFDSSGDIIARYLYGDAVDDLLARWRSVDHPDSATNDGIAWYLTDHLGTVHDIVDDSGSIINTYTYDAFGKILSQTSAAAGDRYTFTGREWISAANLYYYRARFYDPRLGRFTSQDPLGFRAGDANLYRYVSNSPTTYTDPSGNTQFVERVIGDITIGMAVGAIFRMACHGFVAWTDGNPETTFADGAYYGANRYAADTTEGIANTISFSTGGLASKFLHISQAFAASNKLAFIASASNPLAAPALGLAGLGAFEESARGASQELRANTEGYKVGAAEELVCSAGTFIAEIAAGFAFDGFTRPPDFSLPPLKRRPSDLLEPPGGTGKFNCFVADTPTWMGQLSGVQISKTDAILMSIGTIGFVWYGFQWKKNRNSKKSKEKLQTRRTNRER